MVQNKNIDHYIVEKVLTKNKFGITYKCLDSETNKRVILKEIKTALSEESLRVLDKINFIGNNKFPKSYTFSSGNSNYIVRDYLEGTDLKTILNSPIRYSHFSQIFIVKLYLQLLKQLEVLHQSGVLHTDIKPSNILIQHGPKEKIKNWNPENVRLIDYERAITFPANSAFKYKGFSMIYSPPEQILKRSDLFDESMDIFAATITLLETLSKQKPLYDCNAEVMINLQLTYPIPKPRKVSQELFDIISPAICKQRFPRPPRQLSYNEVTQVLKSGIEQRIHNPQPLIDKLNLWLSTQDADEVHWFTRLFKRVFIEKQ